MGSFWINYTGRRDEYPLPDGATNRGRLNQTPPIMTPNKAAAEIRGKILRKMRQLESGEGPKWEELRTYIKGMAARASKKRGGLGRK